MTRVLFCLLLGAITAPLNLLWALPASYAPAVPFYRSTLSQFSSGQASRLQLQKSVKNQEYRHQHEVSWNKKKYFVSAQQLVKEIDCSRFVILHKNSQLLSKPLSQSPVIANLEKDADLELLEVQDYWAKVRSLKNHKVGWLSQSSLKLRTDDTGVFVSLIDSYLRKGPGHDSSVVTTVPKSQRLKILGFDNGFLKTQYLHHQGYVDLNHLVSKADFALWALKDNKNWLAISHRENEFLITKKNKKIPLDQFTAFTGDPHKAVVIEPEDKSPPLRAHVKILSSEAVHWAASELSGHGLVWWKKESTAQQASQSPSPQILSTEELLKRRIFSIAFEAGKTIKGLVSAEGVFRTEDGITWQQIPQFGNQDLPVATISKGAWFVGAHKSFDHGKTFEAFIRWDQLAPLIQNHIGRNPRHIRLQKIEVLAKNRLAMAVDTGPSRIQLHYDMDKLSWKVVK